MFIGFKPEAPALNNLSLVPDGSLSGGAMSGCGPFVWTGRALQAESDDLEKLVLRICIRPIHGAFELLAIMDIRARSISFATRPLRPEGPPDHERAGETFLTNSPRHSGRTKMRGCTRARNH